MSQLTCATHDEPCPATQPASAAPAWDCTGAPPANVLAHASLGAPNEQVARLCVFVYESEAFAGEHYVAVDFDNGADPRGPDDRCATDIRWRRYLYLSDLDGGDCEGVHIAFPESIEGQPLSTGCRKFIRNIANQDGIFDPDIQYFAASRAEAEAKLAILDTAEIACLGVDSTAPYRDSDEWVVQASAPLVAAASSSD
jgi:hypothetical protein